MRGFKLALGSILLAALAACSSAPVAGAQTASEEFAASGGTQLSATGTASAPVCLDGDSATVTISGVLTTTGAVDSAVATYSLDGAAPVTFDTIEPGDFVHTGP